MKDFNDFLSKYSNDRDFQDYMAEAAAGNLSKEQFSAVSKMILILQERYSLPSRSRFFFVSLIQLSFHL